MINTPLIRALVLALAVVAGHAAAQDSYPSKPVKIVIGFGPGSGTDLVARMLAEELTKTLCGTSVGLTNGHSFTI